MNGSKRIFQPWLYPLVLALPGVVYAQNFSCDREVLRQLLWTGIAQPSYTYPDDLSLRNLIDGSHGIKLEVGAAVFPYCKTCIQLDRYADQRHMYADGLREKLGRTPTSEEIEQSLRRASRRNDETWAAARNGALGDAHHLPFADGSLNLVLSKNFPWFGPFASEEVVRPILQEYNRVLSSNGEIYLLKEDSMEPLETFAIHVETAKQLGFKVRPITTPRVGGVVLSK